MHWFILFILLLLFIPFLHLGLVFLIIFFVINILLVIIEIVFRLAFRKKTPPFSPRQRRGSKPASPFGKNDDIEDAEFREEK